MQIETGFLCGDGARVICFFARVIQQLGFWTQKFQANFDYYDVWRRAEMHFARPSTEASKPALTDLCLAAKRRAEAIHVVFFSNKYPSPAR